MAVQGKAGGGSADLISTCGISLRLNSMVKLLFISVGAVPSPENMPVRLWGEMYNIQNIYKRCVHLKGKCYQRLIGHNYRRKYTPHIPGNSCLSRDVTFLK